MSAVFKPSNRIRVVACTLGVAAVGAVFVDTQRLIWRGTAQIAQEYGAPRPSVPRAHSSEALLFGPTARAQAVQSWNRAVDATLGHWATELAKRGL